MLYDKLFSFKISLVVLILVQRGVYIFYEHDYEAL